LAAGLAATFGLAAGFAAGLATGFVAGFAAFFAGGVMILLSFVTLGELWLLDREKPKEPRKPRFFESS
jgi:hypothetical protein